MKESIVIILPLPPAILSPNKPVMSRGGRIGKANAAKKYRQGACDAAIEQQVETGPWKLATIKATFYHKTKRRRDDVNHLAMLKPAYDGLVQSKLLVDDSSEHLQTLTPEFYIDRKCPRVELEITRLA